MMKITILTALLALQVPAFAAPLPPIRSKSLGAKAAGESTNFKITYKIRHGELEDSGSFVVLSGSQSNYVAGGEKAFEFGAAGAVKGVEFKKHGAIVNCVAVAKPDTSIVRAECQFELSGPLAPAGELKARSIASFQFQTAFEVERGRALVLFEGPSRLIEVKIEAVAP